MNEITEKLFMEFCSTTHYMATSLKDLPFVASVIEEHYKDKDDIIIFKKSYDPEFPEAYRWVILLPLKSRN